MSDKLSLSPLLNLYAFACHVLFSVLCLTNIGFVQCFSLGSLLSLYAYMLRFVMRTSPHKLRVCALLTPQFPLEFCTRVFLCFAYFASQKPGLCSGFPSAPFEFVRLCLLCYVMPSSPYRQTSGLCSACTSVPFGILHACVFMFCVLRLANTGFVQCFSLSPF